LLLRTFGGLTLEAGAGEPVPSLGPRALALLAIVAAAGPRGISRDKILGILWPDSDEEQARHTLSQTLYRLRRESGASWITGTAQLRLGPAIGCDVVEFQQALDTDRLDHAAALYTGPFLDGFYLTGAPEFERWAEENRTRVKRAAIKALEALARRADEAGAHPEAAGWWRRLGGLEPLEAAYAAGHIRALTAAGDRIGALAVAREHESRVRRELEAEPDPVIVALAAGLRSAPDRPATTTAAIPTMDTPPAPAGGAPAPASGGTTAVDATRTAPMRRRRWVPAALIGLLIASVAVVWGVGQADAPPITNPPFLAIGTIRPTDTTTFGPVLRDMVATGLARVAGLDVVSNSRLLELLPSRAEASTAAAADAARRAGASQIVEGEVGVASGQLVLTLRRVDLRSGRVLHGYTARAADPWALADSATAAIAADLGLDPPPGVLAGVRTRSAVAYALYEQGLRAYYHADMVTARQLMEAALQRDSTFAMAAAYAWRSNLALMRLDEADRLLPVVRRLATRAVDRERLWIEGLVANYGGAPLAEFLRIARDLTGRFPDDPDGQILLGHALFASGDWAGAVESYGRAVAIDSAAGAIRGAQCRVCQALSGLAEAYLWWDSLAAAERTGRRLVALRPDDGAGWGVMTESLLRQGRRADAEAALANSIRVNPAAAVAHFGFHLDRDLIRSGRSDELAARAVSELRTATPEERGELPWLLAFALRNLGHFREANDLAADGTLPGGAGRMSGHRDPTTLAIVALEDARPREAARWFLDAARSSRTAGHGAGSTARNIAWHMTLAATALAAAGDTAAVRALADSVQRIGAASSFGRDPRLHHFLRGLLLQQQNRHAEAVESFRQSLFSLTDGYTRINLELARSLVVLDRPREAVAVLQPALRGGVDGANTYVTHTELHEALARAFDAAGQRDSAAAHYAAVERAWRSADARLAERYGFARDRARSQNAPVDPG
jgi:DNA-binding SARP family transcriptional activator/TolB-like protein